jgi:MFS transporter, DHA2 family, methylenomycin A resistance protein
METIEQPRTELRPASSLALVVICLGYFMVIVDTTVVNVALPAIGRDTHGGVSGLQWVVDAYTLAFAGLLLTGGALAERLGARRVFTAGLAVFAAASAACGLAPGLGLLIAARLVQGAGAALLVPASLVLLQAAYPTRASRARAFGAWGAIAGIGAASGPIVGGLLVTAWSWRGVFFLNLPFALAALVLTPRSVPDTGPRPRGVDLPGQLLGVAGLGLLTWALVRAGQAGWTSPLVLAGFCLSAAAGAGFAVAEYRAADPMLPLRLFARPAFRAGSAVGLLINLGFYGQLFLMSLYLQDVRGYSALTAGLALLPEAALLIVASTLSGRIMARTGPRPPMLAGLTLGGAGLLGLIVAGSDTSVLRAAGRAHGRGWLRDGADDAGGDGRGDRVGARRPGRDRVRRGQHGPAVRRGARRRAARVAGAHAGGVHPGPACRAGHRGRRLLRRGRRHVLECERPGLTGRAGRAAGQPRAGLVHSATTRSRMGARLRSSSR